MCGCVEEGVDGGGDVGACVAGMYVSICIYVCIDMNEN